MLDANVLYPAGLRDMLLRLADRYLFAPLWSADIHAEWTRSLSADRPDLDARVLERTRAVMDGHFPEAVVTEYAAFAGDLDLPDPGDRHVLAAEHPDAFIVGLLETDPDSALAAVRGHRAALRRPSRTAGEHLAAIERLGLHRTVALLRGHQDAI